MAKSKHMLAANEGTNPETASRTALLRKIYNETDKFMFALNSTKIQ